MSFFLVIKGENNYHTLDSTTVNAGMTFLRFVMGEGDLLKPQAVRVQRLGALCTAAGTSLLLFATDRRVAYCN